MTDNRRHFSRILFTAEASLITSEGEQKVKVVDISLKGALVQPLEKNYLQIGSHCTLKLRLGEYDAAIRMEVTLAHLESGHYGLSCREIDLDSMTHLRRLVELNLADETLLNRELSALSAQ